MLGIASHRTRYKTRTSQIHAELVPVEIYDKKLIRRALSITPFTGNKPVFGVQQLHAPYHQSMYSYTNTFVYVHIYTQFAS